MFKNFLKKTLYISLILIFLSISNNYFCIYADDIDSDISENSESIETANTNTECLNINSRSYVVIDRLSNTILYGKNQFNKVKMASTTKIMTSTIVIENCNLNDTVEISKKAANTGGSRLGLKTGDKITVHDLLYGLMMRSGNDAAVALAEYTAGSIENFANLMNNKAKDLNLNNTHFVTPHGLDQDEHYTTAYELALLSNYALKNKTFKTIVGTQNYTITINGYSKSLTNTNELLGNLNGVYGIKTGFTNGANRCLVTACKRNNLDIICVVLGADTKKFRTQDSIKLIEYVFNNFQPVNIEEIASNEFKKWKSENISSFYISKSASQNLELYLTDNNFSYIPINKNNIENITTDISCIKSLSAPILADTKIGTLSILVRDNPIVKYNIIIKNNIYEKNILDYIIQFYKSYSNYSFLK